MPLPLSTLTKTMTAILFSLSLAVLVFGCEKGPAEKLGQKIDNGVQNTKDAVRDAKDDLSKPKN